MPSQSPFRQYLLSPLSVNTFSVPFPSIPSQSPFRQYFLSPLSVNTFSVPFPSIHSQAPFRQYLLSPLSVNTFTTFAYYLVLSHPLPTPLVFPLLSLFPHSQPDLAGAEAGLARSDWQVLEGSDGEGGKAFCRSVAVSAPKIRLMRSADISAGRTLQVLNLIAFPRPEYDLPYFCADLVTFPLGPPHRAYLTVASGPEWYFWADLVTSAQGHLIICKCSMWCSTVASGAARCLSLLRYFCANLVIFPRAMLIVLCVCALCLVVISGAAWYLCDTEWDLNPLHQSEQHFSKYIAPIMPIANKYIEHLPWGGEFTAESLQFFSPALLWAKLPLDADVTAHVLPAFKEYLQAWLRMVEACEPTSDPAVMAHNMESQHRYICWRSVKDPGRPLLTRLFGSERCESTQKSTLEGPPH
ncbi:unnamed protein product [Closterium sp. NIES-65]|nr:unnamed protein product [Closterium sp. NIES-65]